MESPAKQPKPLTVGKLVMGVCLGILLACAVLGVGYYLAVEQPRAAAEHRAQIEADTARYKAETEASKARMAEMQAQADQVKTEYRANHPGDFNPDGTAKSHTAAKK